MKKINPLLRVVFLILLVEGSGDIDLFSQINSVGYNKSMTLITPSDQWREALPAGNGRVGALVYGSISNERILFNHNELWYQGKISQLPDMSQELPVVRKLMLEGKYLQANDHYTKMLREKGFDGKNGIYHPAFDLLLYKDCHKLFEDYSRTLNFESGEIEVKWTEGDTRFSRKLFVSVPDNITVLSISANRDKSVNGEVSLDIHDLKDAILQNGKFFNPGFSYTTTVDNEFIIFRASGSDGGEFGGVVRVIPRKGKIESVRGERGGPDRIRFKEADEIIMIIGVYANQESRTAVPFLKKELSSLKGDYDYLFNRHKPLHSKRFNAMSLNLGLEGCGTTPNEYLLLDAYQNPASKELIQKLFDYGRYLLISGSRAGGNPANLQGIWNGDYRPPWSSLYGLNENLEMNYWQALPGNMMESSMALFDYFDAHLDEFRYNAKQLWGCRGIYIPPFMSPESGILRITAPHVINWTDAAGWLASFYYDYYLFTGDEEFLRQRAVPFMKEVAMFYEDFIVLDEKTHTNMFFPSQSPENQPENMELVDPESGRIKRVKVQINSTIAVAIAKEVLGNLTEACKFLNIEQDNCKIWESLLMNMPDYQINKDGAIREWIHPDFKDNYEHRHQSHIYPLFPGHEIRQESDKRLYDACKVAIDKRLVIGLESQTGWSLAHMANVYARLGEGEKAREALNIISRCCLGQNFFTYHNDWRRMGATLPVTWGRTAPFQMDANFGISAAVIEMLCGSEKDMIRLLPALPENWTTGEFKDMLTRVGTQVSLSWDMEARELIITMQALRNTEFNLQFPDTPKKITCSPNGKLRKSGYGDRYRLVHMKKGQKITIHAVLNQSSMSEALN